MVEVRLDLIGREACYATALAGLGRRSSHARDESWSRVESGCRNGGKRLAVIDVARGHRERVVRGIGWFLPGRIDV